MPIYEKEVEDCVPANCGLIRAWTPQMEQLEGCENVVLVLLSCRKFGVVPDMKNPHWETEKVVASLQQKGYKVLMLDLRQTCRRCSGEKNGCVSFNHKEAALLTWAVAINIRVAIEVYGIKFCSVISCAEVSFRQYRALLQFPLGLEKLPHFHVRALTVKIHVEQLLIDSIDQHPSRLVRQTGI